MAHITKSNIRNKAIFQFLAFSTERKAKYMKYENTKYIRRPPPTTPTPSSPIIKGKRDSMAIIVMTTMFTLPNVFAPSSFSGGKKFHALRFSKNIYNQGKVTIA